MVKAQGTTRFAYNITICIHTIIPTESNLMIKVQGTMKFAYGITVYIYNIIQLLTYAEVDIVLLNSKCHIDRRGAEVNMITFTVQ